MRGILRSTIAAVVAVLALLPGTASGTLPAGDVAWVYPDNAFFTHVGVVRVNADATPDVIGIAGDRAAFYFSCLPVGNPTVYVDQVHDETASPVPEIVALDGGTGLPLWRVPLAEDGGGSPPPVPLRNRFDFVWESRLGDLNGDGRIDLLVVRGTYDVDKSARTYLQAAPTNGVTRTTLYDPTSGHVIWERTEPVPNGLYDMRTIRPVDLGDVRAGVDVSRLIQPSPYDITSKTTLVRFGDAGPPSPLVQLSSEASTLTTAIVAPAAAPGPVRIVLAQDRLKQWDYNDAVDFVGITVPFRDGAPQPFVAWTARGAGGLPVGEFPGYVTRSGVLVTAQGNDARPGKLGGTAAYDLATGQELWRIPIYAGLGLGPSALLDLDGDGNDEFVAAYMGTFLPAVPLAMGVAVVDPATGTVRWQHADRAGKFLASALGAADIDGDGVREVVASGMLRDGTFCGGPQDDEGLVSVLDSRTGAQECRFPLDRVAWSLASGDLDGSRGEEIVAATVGGRIWAFRDAAPGCGVLSLDP